MKQLRQTILADEQLIASKRRFGLFSQPPPLAVGDDSLFASKLPKKGQNGKPITQPRNLLPGPNRTGVSKKSYIQVPESIYQKDPYQDIQKTQQQYFNKMHTKSAMHEVDFVPGCGYKTIANSPYPHIQEKQHQQKKIKKDENGRVKTEPANVITNPLQRVDHMLFKPLNHMPDPYSRPQQISKQERQIWRSKIKHQVMFKSMSHAKQTFTKDKIQYGIDDKTKLQMSQKRGFSYGQSNIVNHEAKFKLARRGHGDPIGRYPEFAQPKKRAITEISESRKLKTEKSDNQKQLWKPSTGNVTRPTPSISLMAKNMRKCI